MKTAWALALYKERVGKAKSSKVGSKGLSLKARIFGGITTHAGLPG